MEDKTVAGNSGSGPFRQLEEVLRRLAERLMPPQAQPIPIPVRIDEPRRRIR